MAKSYHSARTTTYTGETVLLKEMDSCCGRIYRSEAVRMLLGDSWHPGGLALTGQLGYLSKLESSQRVLDVACGNGTSANFVAKEFGCNVVGVDILSENARDANSQSFSNNLMGNEFIVGDSHRLPLSDHSFDAALLECTLSSFQNKELVLQEINRILRPDAKLGISDVVVSGDIPAELGEAQFQELCVTGALSLDQYSELLKLSGFETVICQNKKNEALEFIDSIQKKLFVAKLLAGIGKLSVEKESIEYAKHIATLTWKTIEEDKLGYAVMVAQKMDGR